MAAWVASCNNSSGSRGSSASNACALAESARASSASNAPTCCSHGDSPGSTTTGAGAGRSAPGADDLGSSGRAASIEADSDSRPSSLGTCGAGLSRGAGAGGWTPAFQRRTEKQTSVAAIAAMPSPVFRCESLPAAALVAELLIIPPAAQLPEPGGRAPRRGTRVPASSRSQCGSGSRE